MPVISNNVASGINLSNVSLLPYYDEKHGQYVVFDNSGIVICYVDDYDVAVDLIVVLEEYYKTVVPSGATSKEAVDPDREKENDHEV